MVDPVKFDRDKLVNVLGRRREGPLTSNGAAPVPAPVPAPAPTSGVPGAEGQGATPMGPVDAAYEEILNGHTPRAVGGESAIVEGQYDPLNLTPPVSSPVLRSSPRP